MVSYLDELDALIPTVPTDRREPAALGPRCFGWPPSAAPGSTIPGDAGPHQRGPGDSGPASLLAPEQKVVLNTDPLKAHHRPAVFSPHPTQLNYTNNLLRMGFTADDFADGGSDQLLDAVIVWGDADTVLDRIDKHHAAGADHVAIQVLTSGDYGRGPLPRQQWRELAAALKARN